jgi:hypothetical protein
MPNKTTLILGFVAFVLAVLLAAPLYAQPTARPATDSLLAPVVVGDSCPLTDEQKQKSVDTFTPIAQFMASEPRCVNCHGAINPFAANTTHIGGRYELKFDKNGRDVDEGATFSDCQACHSGLPGWQIPPKSLSFNGKDAPTLCEQMQSRFFVSPVISPSGAEEFIKHMKLDITDVHFIEEAFKGTRGLDEVGKEEYEKATQSKYKLEPPLGMTHDQLVQMAEAWIQAMGGNIQQDPQCGCVPPPCYKITSHKNWSGKVSWNYSGSGSNNDPAIGVRSVTVRESGSVAAQLTVAHDGWMQAFVTGSASAYSSIVFKFPPNDPPHTAQGGPLLPQGSQMTVTLDPEKCTYNFWVRVRVTLKDEGGNSFNDDSGYMQSANRPLSSNDTELSGSAEFAVHTIAPDSCNCGDSYWAPQVVEVTGEKGAGSAQVSWSFTPVP